MCICLMLGMILLCRIKWTEDLARRRGANKSRKRRTKIWGKTIMGTFYSEGGRMHLCRWVVAWCVMLRV